MLFNVPLLRLISLAPAPYSLGATEGKEDSTTSFNKDFFHASNKIHSRRSREGSSHELRPGGVFGGKGAAAAAAWVSQDKKFPAANPVQDHISLSLQEEEEKKKKVFKLKKIKEGLTSPSLSTHHPPKSPRKPPPTNPLNPHPHSPHQQNSHPDSPPSRGPNPQIPRHRRRRSPYSDCPD